MTTNKQEQEQVQGRIDPSKVNVLNQFHASFAPVQCRSAILYVSGCRQLTEFRVSGEGFTCLVWVKSADGKEVSLVSYRPQSNDAGDLWRALEVDCLSGHARLIDRASVRGVGSAPKSRKEHRIVDDVSTICNWIDRAEAWYAKHLRNERKEVLKANGALASGPDNSKIPFLPPSFQLEVSHNAALNREVNANVLPQHISVGAVKHWDADGALMVRGKKVGGVSTRTVIGMRERIQRLRDMAARQVRIASDLEAGDLGSAEVIAANAQRFTCAEYLEFALDSEERANAIQSRLNAKMEHARAAKLAKTASRTIDTVKVSGSVAAQVLEDISGLTAQRKADLKKPESQEELSAE
jgi:hypothetical protein